MPLSQQQIDSFHRDGFVKVRVFEPAELQPVKDELARVIDERAAELHAAGKLKRLYADEPFETRMGLLMADCPEINDGFDIDSILSQPLFDHIRHPAMLDVLEQLIGGEISLNPIHHVRVKPPARSEADEQASYFNVPWHQDSGVTTEDSDASPILTCWRPLGRASDEMGCMRLIPGVHRDGHLPHVAGPQIDPARLPAVEPVPVPCEAGEVVIMTQFVPHHSTPNRSDICRWSMDLRYQRTGTPSGRAWLPSTVLRSRRDPSSEVHDAAIWAESWRRAKASPGNRGTVHRVAAATAS